MRIIEQHYASPETSLDWVARRVGLSPCHLTRLLKTSTGSSFSQHLHNTRVTAAQRLLRTTLLSIKQIAAEVGYANTTQLERHFRKHSGRSPRTYRL